MPIAVLSEYTEKEYEPFDPYSRFYPAMPISVCFSDTALCTLGKSAGVFICFAFLQERFVQRFDFSNAGVTRVARAASVIKGGLCQEVQIFAFYDLA